jgi:hypothetical protein
MAQEKNMIVIGTEDIKSIYKFSNLIYFFWDRMLQNSKMRGLRSIQTHSHKPLEKAVTLSGWVDSKQVERHSGTQAHNCTPLKTFPFQRDLTYQGGWGISN